MEIISVGFNLERFSVKLKTKVISPGNHKSSFAILSKPFNEFVMWPTSVKPSDSDLETTGCCGCQSEQILSPSPPLTARHRFAFSGPGQMTTVRRALQKWSTPLGLFIAVAETVTTMSELTKSSVPSSRSRNGRVKVCLLVTLLVQAFRSVETSPTH